MIPLLLGLITLFRFWTCFLPAFGGLVQFLDTLNWKVGHTMTNLCRVHVLLTLTCCNSTIDGSCRFKWWRRHLLLYSLDCAWQPPTNTEDAGSSDHLQPITRCHFLGKNCGSYQGCNTKQRLIYYILQVWRTGTVVSMAISQGKMLNPIKSELSTHHFFTYQQRKTQWYWQSGGTRDDDLNRMSSH